MPASVSEQRWCFSTRNMWKCIVHNLLWKYPVCLVRNPCLFFRLACLLIEAFALKLYLWKKCDSIFCIQCLAFCFISLLAYLLLTHFCGFLHNHYLSGLFWVKTVLRLKWHVERDYHCYKGIFCWKRDAVNLDVTGYVDFDMTLFRKCKAARIGSTIFLEFKSFFNKYTYLPISKSHKAAAQTRGQNWL